jgi:hypothetical protein
MEGGKMTQEQIRRIYEIIRQAESDYREAAEKFSKAKISRDSENPMQEALELMIPQRTCEGIAMGLSNALQVIEAEFPGIEFESKSEEVKQSGRSN